MINEETVKAIDNDYIPHHLQKIRTIELDGKTIKLQIVSQVQFILRALFLGNLIIRV